MNPNVITLSHPTYVGPSGATAAATYQFFTKNYKPPAEERMVDYDVVKNQNGKFKYVYDNGPGFRRWAPFSVVCEQQFSEFLGGATAGMQFTRLREIWNYPGVFQLSAPEGLYNVHWAKEALERSFRVFPAEVNHTLEYEIILQLEEG